MGTPRLTAERGTRRDRGATLLGCVSSLMDPTMATFRNRAPTARALNRHRRLFGLERLELRCVLSAGSSAVAPPLIVAEVHSDPHLSSSAMDFDSGQLHGTAYDFDAPSSFGTGSKMAQPQEYGLTGGHQTSALSQGLPTYLMVGSTYVIIIFVPAYDSPTATVSHSAPSGSANLQSAHFADQKSNVPIVFTPAAASETDRFAPPPVADAAGQAVLQTAQAPAQATSMMAVSRSPVTIATNTKVVLTAAATDARSRSDVVSIGQLSAQPVVQEAQTASIAPQLTALESGAREGSIERTSKTYSLKLRRRQWP